MTRPTLPPDEAQRLLALRNDSLPALRTRVRALRASGWTLAAIGTPIGANRSTTRLWEKEGEALDEHPLLVAPVPAAPVTTRAKTVKLVPDVPQAERAELQKLAAQARLVRGWTPATHPTRVAAEKFETLLSQYEERGVPVKLLAQHTGVTYRAIAARLERRSARVAS